MYIGNRNRHQGTKKSRTPVLPKIVDGELCWMVPLTQGKWALVDKRGYDLISEDVWFFDVGGYAVRNGRDRREKRLIQMHRVICQTPVGMITDHINGDRLDNRTINLRSVNATQSSINRGLDKRNKSGKSGVSWHDNLRKWTVRIVIDGRARYMGVYEDLNEAIRVRIALEEKYYGDYRRKGGNSNV